MRQPVFGSQRRNVHVFFSWAYVRMGGLISVFHRTQHTQNESLFVSNNRNGSKQPFNATATFFYRFQMNSKLAGSEGGGGGSYQANQDTRFNAVSIDGGI